MAKNNPSSKTLACLRTSGIVALALALVLLGPCAAAPLPQGAPFAHPAVLRNAQLEARLSPHMRNPFYQDARTARALARHSWFGEGEMPVQQREAEKIPRREIYNVLVHAGFLPRQRISPDSLQSL